MRKVVLGKYFPQRPVFSARERIYCIAEHYAVPIPLFLRSWVLYCIRRHALWQTGTVNKHIKGYRFPPNFGGDVLSPKRINLKERTPFI